MKKSKSLNLVRKNRDFKTISIILLIFVFYLKLTGRHPWSCFQSDLNSPAPFSPDLAERAGGPLEGSGA